jgi:alginate O-acetyltransferase complex protein AlgI
MPFSSLIFVCVFLPACLLVAWFSPARARNMVVLAASLLFYAWGAPRFMPVIFALGVADFWLARRIASSEGPTRRRLLIAGICVHVSVLAYFKYANFFVGEVNAARTAMQLAPWGWTAVILPIGVSFLTFEEISYLTDVYRGDAPPARRWSHYLLFLMLFPHSIAGPIFRWKDLAAQFEARKPALDAVARGMSRFSVGLAKKLFVADSVAHIADGIFGLPTNELGGGLAWIGALAYALQIYFDFSGYSDMAIGLGGMLGFTFKENFREPYTARSLGEFWQRWHISLSTWMRDYLYIPLGGNRRGRLRTEVNSVLVFAISGFWHGAAWTFLVWGLYHGVLVTLERRIEPVLSRIPDRARALFTFVVVVVGWVPFRATSMTQVLAMLKAMVGLAHPMFEPRPLPAELFPRLSTLMFVASLAWVVTRALTARRPDVAGPSGTPWWRSALSLALLAMCIMHMTNTRYTPLIYFKF